MKVKSYLRNFSTITSASAYKKTTAADSTLKQIYKEKLIDGSIIRIQMKTNCPKTNIFFASFFVLSLIVIFMICCAVINRWRHCCIFFSYFFKLFPPLSLAIIHFCDIRSIADFQNRLSKRFVGTRRNCWKFDKRRSFLYNYITFILCQQNTWKQKLLSHLQSA